MSDPTSSSGKDAGNSNRAEQRKWVRYLCTPESGRRVLARVGNDPGLFPIHNISAGGLSVALNNKIEPETVVYVHLNNPTRKFSCTVPMRVVFVIEHPNGDYVHGGSFARVLSDDEVQGLL